MADKNESSDKFAVGGCKVLKAGSFKSVDELIAAAKEKGITLSAETAQRIFEKMKPENIQLSDDDLEHVAGGQIEIVNDDM